MAVDTTVLAEELADDAEVLIRAAGGSDGELGEVLDDLGLERVGRLLVDELAFRCDLPVNEHEVGVQVTMSHRGRHLTHTPVLRAGAPVRVEDGAWEAAAVRVEYELAALVRLLFGPAAAPDAGTHRTELRLDRPEVHAHYRESVLAVWPSIGRAVDTVLRACSPEPPELSRIAVQHGTDKWGSLHWYTPHYERHLARLRDQPVRVLEIGIGGYGDPSMGGDSLRMWKRYFRRGLVHGLDVYPKHGVDSSRLHTIQGDQNDPAFLSAMAAEHGPFDVVVDDGSHVNEHVITSFHALFPHVRPGGFYVIEDVFSSYLPGFGGRANEAAGEGTSLGLVKSLVDALNHEEWNDAAGPAGGPGYVEAHVVGLHVYHNIAFVEKGVNAEGGMPPWIPHSYDGVVEAFDPDATG